MIKNAFANMSLKTRNQPQLVVFLTVNAVILAVLAFGRSYVAGGFETVSKGDWSFLGKAIAVPAGLSVIIGLLSWAVPRHWKEILIFWRTDIQRMPSSRAFTEIAPADFRISLDALSARLGSLPTNPQEQSSLWYSVYRKHCKELPVQDANAAYLLYRDMAAFIPLLLIALIIGAPIAGMSPANFVVASLLLLIELSLMISAARNAGTRLVSNVLAIEASKPGNPISPSSGSLPVEGAKEKPKTPRTRKKKDSE